jgi:hypothetical protein
MISILPFYHDAGMQPYHVHAYVRLSNLWANGGIFSDLSFFFLGTLTKSVIKYVSNQLLWCYAIAILYMAMDFAWS